MTTYTAANNEDQLSRDLASVLNAHSCEQFSNTPDFILADYLVSCLRAWNAAQDGRCQWYGDDYGDTSILPAASATE